MIVPVGLMQLLDYCKLSSLSESEDVGLLDVGITRSDCSFVAKYTYLCLLPSW